MTLTAKFECDGNDCFNEHELSTCEPYDHEMLPDSWSFDEVNEFHYCPYCVKKMIENGELEPE
jgi:hypothetical protein